MCWSLSVSTGMVIVGAAATVYTARKGQPAAIYLTLGYFTTMEALQAAGYLVVNQCGLAANQVLTLLSVLHITFQPFFVNAFHGAHPRGGPPQNRLGGLWSLLCFSNFHADTALSP